MEYTPKVSILIPVYNRETIILDSLNSAVNQTYKNIEIVVVDNKSTDNTFNLLIDYAKKHDNVKVYQNEKNIGPVKNWRKCIDFANGEYAKILWSDDTIAPTFIEKTIPYLIHNKDVGFVFTGVEVKDILTGKKRKDHFIGETGTYSSKCFIQEIISKWGIRGGYPVSPGNAIFRMKDLSNNLIKDIPNKTDTEFNSTGAGNDVLMFLLTLRDYSNFAFINESLSFYKSHQDSITVKSNKSYLHEQYFQALLWFLQQHDIQKTFPDIALPHDRFIARQWLIHCYLNKKIVNLDNFINKYSDIKSHIPLKIIFSEIVKLFRDNFFRDKSCSKFS